MGDNNGTVMPVAPIGYGAGNGFGGFGGDSSLWVLLFLFALIGNGWGGFGGFGGGFGGAMGAVGAMDGAMIYPYLLDQSTNSLVTNGFDNQALNSAISGLSAAVSDGFSNTALGIAGVNQNICQASGNITSAISNGFSQAEISNNARQIANMQQAFNAQTAVTSGMNDLAMGLQNCCCENRASVADLKYTVANEACNTRFANANNTRDIIDSQVRGNQAILDKLCQLELDGVKAQVEAKNDRISELQTQLNMANLAASQGNQTAAILAGQAQRAAEVEQYVNPTPVPAYVVQNPNCCYNGCNSGCGSF